MASASLVALSFSNTSRAHNAPASSVPKPSLLTCRVGRKVCVVDRVRLGVFKTSLCAHKPALSGSKKPAPVCNGSKTADLPG